MEDSSESHPRPETPLDEQALTRLLGEVNSSGNRTWEAVFKNPLPIARAHYDRINEIIRNLPAVEQKAPGIAWMKVDAVIEGLLDEFGVGFADMVWDTVTAPIHLFVPQLRHPNFKKRYAELYMPHMTGQSYGDKIRLWFSPGGRSQIAGDTSPRILNPTQTGGLGSSSIRGLRGPSV